MMIRFASALLFCWSLVVPTLSSHTVPAVPGGPAISQAATATAPASAKTWLDRPKEIEEYLKTAEVVSMEEIGLGVTKPKRATLAPGGMVDRIAWKTIKPGIHKGFYESYKSEIAAYELDKVLGLDMIPPTVEKRVKGDVGAAVMWVSGIKSFGELGGPPTAPPAKQEAWNRQLIKAKMFDCLIYNKDPNLGNWLVDPSWNLILIDHTRSFTSGKEMAHVLTRVDGEFWDKIKALTEEQLTASLGQWVGKKEIKAMLERRTKMQEVIDKLVKDKGEAAVILR